MRDNGCTGRGSLVSPHQCRGRHICVKMINGTTISCPIARVEVCSSFLIGHVQVAVMKNPLLGFIVGNVKGAKDFQRSDALRQ